VRRLRAALAALVAVALVAGCTDDEPEAEPTPAPTETTAPGQTTASTEAPAQGTLATIGLAIEEIATVDQPTAMASRPGSRDLYVAEKGGRIRLIEVEEDQFGSNAGELTHQLQTTPLLDLSGDVINRGERGLLGLTFSSDGRKLYLDYTRQPDGHTVIVEYTLGDSRRIDDDSRRELLVVEQPYANHNGGQLAIGPDGYLYIGLGDGGGRGDPLGHGQDTSTLLGSILRIDPERASDEGPAYVIPPGNPFADSDESAPEIWAYGARNPWRFSFDGQTGDLWVADVGQNEHEEINRLPSNGGFDAGRGANLGWAEMEGTHPFDGGENPADGVLPIFEYGRDEGCSVIGGYVYRGDAIPGLQGTYLYTDYCGTGVRGLQVDGDTVIDQRTWDLPLDEPHSMGQDDLGELYVLLGGGRIAKLVAPEAPVAPEG
jgi:glucose/arabinose dehydrogenase